MWVGVGSVDETDTLHGCSHFLEHLLFKGTPERSALDISIALDAVGGEFNAFTAKEYTCFHARVLDEDLPLAVDVLGDMVTSSVISAEDVEAEREVILDEIAMHDDDPDDVVHNLFAEQAWGATSPLGRSIAGTVDSISALDRNRILRFYRRHYRPERMVVAVAGNLDHATVVRLRHQGVLPRATSSPATADPAPPRAPGRELTGAPRPASRPPGHFEQVNVVLGMEGLRARRRPAVRARRAQHRPRRRHVEPAVPGDPRAPRPRLLGLLLRLPPRRLRPGRASRSAACRPSSTRCSARCGSSSRAWPPTASPTTSSRAARGSSRAVSCWASRTPPPGCRGSASAELVHDQLLDVDEVIARIDAVTLDEVRAVAADVFARPEILAVVGPS